MHFAKLVLLFAGTVRSLELCSLLLALPLLDVRITVRCKLLMFLLSFEPHCMSKTRRVVEAERPAQKADQKVSCGMPARIKRLSDDFHRNIAFMRQ